MTMMSRFSKVTNARALSEDEMRAIAPSIFAEVPHESRSQRFRAIPTIEVLRGLDKEGFSVVKVSQSVTRDASRREFTKHLIRLRRLDDRALSVGDTFAEILLKNANDGTSAYDLMAGLWRVACMNGMVCQTQTLDEVKVRHSGDAVAKVIEGTYRVLDNSESLLSAPQDWSQIKVSREAAHHFAEAAHTIRFGDAEGNVSTPIQPAQLLIPRRPADTNNDLWTVFNVAQENVIRGGLSGRVAGGRRTTTREVKGIDQDVKLNKALWTLGERMAELLKSAA